jgi:hypothetical protein
LDQFSRGEAGEAWRPEEIEATVAAYFEMLRKQIRGEPFRKADMVRDLQSMMLVRTRGAVELKLQNISAILIEEDHEWIDGYKPMAHYQRHLREAVLERIRRERRLEETLAAYGTNALTVAQARQLATDDVLVPPPGARVSEDRRSTVRIAGTHGSAMRDFRTKELGDMGEEWVVSLERERLIRAGKAQLAHAVEWSARELGDGLGYDVRSFFPDGRERLIEVKTTNLSASTPFFITKGEVSFSERRPEAFSLYRVHGWGRDPRVYVLDGSVKDRAKLEPQVYLGIPI